MSSVDHVTVQEMRERYLRSLSPIERMDYELACAREKRMAADRARARAETERLLKRIDEKEGAGTEKGLLLSWSEVRLLNAELRRLRGDVA